MPTDTEVQTATDAYWDALQRGETGPALREAAGGVVGSEQGPPAPRPEPPRGVYTYTAQPYVPTDPAERAMAAMMKDVPIAQAERAVEAAMKFQGMRMYQQALREGKPSAEALAAAGPLLFGAGGMSRLQQGVTPTAAANLAFREKQLSYRQQQDKLRQDQAARGLEVRTDPTTGQQYLVTPSGQPHFFPRQRSMDMTPAQAAKALGEASPAALAEPMPDGQTYRDFLKSRLQPAAPAAPGRVTAPGGISIGGISLSGGMAPMTAPTTLKVPTVAPSIAPSATSRADFPAAPRDPKQRVKGTTYSTPKGPHVWTGEGWE